MPVSNKFSAFNKVKNNGGFLSFIPIDPYGEPYGDVEMQSVMEPEYDALSELFS